MWYTNKRYKIKVTGGIMELVKSYLGNNIEFKMINGEVYANATQMAKCFPAKNLSTWINSKGT
jgi:hypothetical protein